MIEFPKRTKRYGPRRPSRRRTAVHGNSKAGQQRRIDFNMRTKYLGGLCAAPGLFSKNTQQPAATPAHQPANDTHPASNVCVRSRAYIQILSCRSTSYKHAQQNRCAGAPHLPLRISDSAKVRARSHTKGDAHTCACAYARL